MMKLAQMKGVCSRLDHAQLSCSPDCGRNIAISPIDPLRRGGFECYRLISTASIFTDSSDKVAQSSGHRTGLPPKRTEFFVEEKSDETHLPRSIAIVERDQCDGGRGTDRAATPKGCVVRLLHFRQWQHVGCAQ